LALTLLSPGELKDRGLDALERIAARAVAEEAFQRDPAFIEERLPLLGKLVDRYFASEVRGLEHLPEEGPFLLVANHSGGFLMPDVWALASAMLERFGVDRVVYPLVFDFALVVPGFGSTLRRLGAIPASVANAERALAEGAGVLVYPGGDWEAYRPWTQRNRIDFHDHHGFVKLALREGVPVIPAVSHGSHDSLIVVTRGEDIGRALGLERLRAQIFPFTFGVPFGLSPIFLPNLPYPAKIVVEVLEPVDWSHHDPGAAEEPDVVHGAYEEITGRMQGALNRLVAERPHPVAARLADASGLTRVFGRNGGDAERDPADQPPARGRTPEPR
jgi:1-acyl-sn-glycerol-3-phosphate acyltransferase